MTNWPFPGRTVNSEHPADLEWPRKVRWPGWPAGLTVLSWQGARGSEVLVQSRIDKSELVLSIIGLCTQLYKEDFFLTIDIILLETINLIFDLFFVEIGDDVSVQPVSLKDRIGMTFSPAPLILAEGPLASYSGPLLFHFAIPSLLRVQLIKTRIHKQGCC